MLDYLRWHFFDERHRAFAAAIEVRDAHGDDAVLDGEKTWISNGGIANFYVVFARSDEGATEVQQLIIGRELLKEPGA